MKKYICFFILISTFLSCTDKKSSNISQYFVKNNTNYNLKLVLFIEKSIIIKDTIIALNKNEEYLLFESGIDGNSHSSSPIYLGDSALVYYNDTISVMHKKNQYLLKRTFLSDIYYDKKEISDNKFIFTYSFTEADYQEALRLYDSIHKR